jgi:hypothetical protein
MNPDEANELLYASGAALEAGVLALEALSRGEAAAPEALDALATTLEDQRVVMAETARAAAAPVRDLRALLPEDGKRPSSDVRVRAERCRALIAKPPPPAAPQPG